jgi:thiamine kinase-like enzyme
MRQTKTMNSDREEAKTLFETCLGQKVKSLTPLPQGLSNVSFRINSTKVLRLKKVSDAPFYSAENEGKILELIRPFAWAPKVFYFDKKNGNLIDAFIPSSSSFHPGKMSDDETNALAQVLRKLHAIKGSESRFEPFERYASYRQRSGVSLSFKDESIISAKAHSIYLSDPLCLCHNDLVEGNILKSVGGRIRLIDFECAGLNNLFFDFASFLSENKIFAPERITFFLRAYFGQDYRFEDFQKTLVWMAYENYLWFYWAKCRYSETGNPDFDAIAKDKNDAMVLLRECQSKHPEFFFD